MGILGASQLYYNFLRNSTFDSNTVRFSYFFSLGAIAFGSSFFGGGTGGTVLQSIGCSGDEQKVADCYHLGFGVLYPPCYHSDADAGVRCLGQFC